MLYSPLIGDLVSSANWGDPEENMKSMIYYGIKYVDQALRGIDFRNGELIGIQAEAKNRKSTMLANLVLNVAPKLKDTWICIDTLESGMPPETYRDVLIAILATRIIIKNHFGERSDWPDYQTISRVCDLVISKEFLWLSKRTPEQEWAIEAAKNYLAKLPIMIFGAAYKQGNARDFEATMARWRALAEGKCPGLEGYICKLFACDHIQQLDPFGISDYAGMEKVVGEYGKFIAQTKSVIIAVSQLSITSVRGEREGLGRATAKGGAKLEAEANVLFRTKYSQRENYKLVIETCATRRQPPPTVVQELDPQSGAFLRPAYLIGDSNE